jgi:copper transport protein
MAIHVGHLLGGGAWLGTLAGFAAIRPRVSATFRTGLLRGFSPVALTGAAALAATGILAGWLYVGSFSNLTGTSYGQVLLLKLALVAGAAACGFVNWRSLQSGRAEPGRVVALELMLAVAIVLTTAVLTETEHP